MSYINAPCEHGDPEVGYLTCHQEQWYTCRVCGHVWDSPAAKRCDEETNKAYEREARMARYKADMAQQEQDRKERKAARARTRRS